MITMLYYSERNYIYESNTTLGMRLVFKIERKKKQKMGMNNHIFMILKYCHKAQKVNNTPKTSF